MPPWRWPLQFSTVNICLVSRYPSRYAIRSIAASMLFNQKAKPPAIREVFSYSPCDDAGVGVLRSNVYIVGGLHPDLFIENPNALHDVSCFNGKKWGKTVFAYNTSPRSPFTIVPDMISPKIDPLVLAVVGGEERLYVLSNNMYRAVRPPVFESYTLSTNSWEQLDPPPFLNPKTKYFDRRRHYAYASAVIGTSICVSTAKTSFKFDVEKKIWEPCMLFEGLHTSNDNYDYEYDYSYDYDYDSDSDSDYDDVVDDYDGDDTPCGPPFGFKGKAVLFEDDVLICMMPSCKNGSVVAYKIEGGKVVDSQSLMAQGLVIPVNAESSCIAGFGNGLFCLVLTIGDVYEEDPSILTVKPFFIKKKTVLKPGDFLHCEVINEFKYEEKDTEGWNPICCFAT